MEGKCTVRLLGGFSVQVDGRRIPDAAWRHRRGADLVKLLALAQGHRMHREQVVDTLWPELGREPASANLRKAIYFARQGMGNENAIEVVAGMVTLWPRGGLLVDADQFEAAARQALATGERHTSAIDLFTGELLPEDRYAEWTEPQREHLRNRYLELLRRAGRWEQILELDPSDEDAHRARMQAFLEAGDRRAAIRQFGRLREVLRADLGVGPSEETVALFERALHMSGEEALSPEERVRALTARALMSWHRQDLESAARVAEEARRLAADWGLGPELGEASTLLGLVAWARGSWPDLFRAESIEVFERAPDQAAFVLEGHLCFAEAALYGANSEAVASLAHELLGTASAVGSPYGQALMTLLIGETDLIAGRLAQAQEHLSYAMSLYTGIGGISGQVLAMIRLAEVAAAAGRADEANRLLAQARPLATQSELVSHLLVRVFAGLIQATRGRRRQLRVVEDAERTLPQVGICGPCSINFWIIATIACTRAGELAKSRTCLREAERLAGMWQGGPWQAATWEARAALRLAEGDRTQAEALLREAEELFAQSGRPLDAARCHAAILTAHRQAVAVSS